MDPVDAESSNVQVCVRIRPLHSIPDTEIGQRCVRVAENNQSHPTSVIVGLPHSECEGFTFDYAAREDEEQEELFKNIAQRLTDNWLQGYNGTIFAYGQTGSGKTFTMMGGDVEKKSNLGLIPRVLDYTFSRISSMEQENKGETKFTIKCSFLEVYDEHLDDLLYQQGGACTSSNVSMFAPPQFHQNSNSKGGANQKPELKIREDHKGVWVEDLKQIPVSSATEAFGLLQKGLKLRHVAATGMNDESSRSHCVFTLYLQSKRENHGISKICNSRLNLVDLAGSERQKLTKAESFRLREGNVINKSLSTLGLVIRGLVEKAAHIHYRDSKLTFLLKDSLGGNSKTILIATVSPLDRYFADTVSTLKFARRAKLIKNTAVINQDTFGAGPQLLRENQRLRNEIDKLKSQLQTEPSNVSSTLSVSASSDQLGQRQELLEKIQTLETLLLASLEKETKETDEKENLRKKNEELRQVCAEQEKCIQDQKMMFKMKERLFEQVRKGEGNNLTPQRKAMRAEIDYFKSLSENNPEMKNLVLANADLRRRIEEYEIRRGDEIDRKKREIERLENARDQLTIEIKEKLKNKLQISEEEKNETKSACNAGDVENTGEWKIELNAQKELANKLQNELQAVCSVIQSLESANEFEITRREEAEDKANEYEQKLQEAMMFVEKLEQELQSELERAQETEEYFTRKENNMQLEISKITQTNSELVEKFNGLEKQLHQLSIEKELLLEEKIEADKKYNHIMAMMVEKEEEISKSYTETIRRLETSNKQSSIELENVTKLREEEMADHAKEIKSYSLAMDELNKTIQQLNERAKDFVAVERENAELNRLMKEKEISENTKILELTQKVEILEKELAQTSEKYESAENQHQSEKHQFQERERELSDQLCEISAEKSAAEAHHTMKERKMVEEIAQSSCEISSLQKQIQEHIQKTKLLEKQLVEMTISFESDISDLKDETISQQQTIRNLEQEIVSAKAENHNLITQLDQSKCSLEEAQRRSNDLSQWEQQLVLERDSLKSALNDLKKQLMEKEQEEKTKVSIFSNETARYQQELEALHQVEADNLRQIESLGQVITGLKSDTASKEKVISTLQEKNRSLKKNETNLNKLYEDAQQKITALMEEKSGLEKSIESLNGVQQKLQDAERLRVEAEKELEQLRQLPEQLETTIKECQAMSQEIELLQKAKQAAEEKCAKLAGNQNAKSRIKYVEEQKKAIFSLQKELEETKKELEHEKLKGVELNKELCIFKGHHDQNADPQHPVTTGPVTRARRNNAHA